MTATDRKQAGNDPFQPTTDIRRHLVKRRLVTPSLAQIDRVTNILQLRVNRITGRVIKGQKGNMMRRSFRLLLTGSAWLCAPTMVYAQQEVEPTASNKGTGDLIIVSGYGRTDQPVLSV
jgi:hypothetical protein